MSRRSPRLFRYSAAPAAARTLRALRAAHPANTFAVVPESLGWGFNILATKPDGSRGLVAKAPLASFGART